MMNGTGQILKQDWPIADPALAAEDELEVPVQINGKVRSRVVVPVATSKEELEKAALAEEKIRTSLEGKQVVKVIVVPGKLVNIVAK